MSIWKLVIIDWLSNVFLLIFKLIMKFLHLFLLKQIIKQPIIS